VFERKNFTDVKPADIAAVAGVSRATFYTYFSDRDDILMAMLEEVEAADDFTIPELPRLRGAVEMSLIEAARNIFEKVGYADATPINISEEADLPVEEFEQHFNGIADVFSAVLEVSRDDFTNPTEAHSALDFSEHVERGIRTYFDNYARNAKLMRLREQLSVTGLDFPASRLCRREDFVARHTKWITTLQEQGQADASLDPELVSRALGAMVSSLAHVHLALEVDTASIDDLVSISTQIWISSLKIPG